MKFSCNADELLKQISNLKEEIDRKLRVTVCTFSSNMVGIAAYNTPLGDAQAFESLYEYRYNSLGLSPVEGLARGGWQASLTPTSTFREVYGSNSAELAISDAFSNMYSQYDLGETVYISNTGPYIENLQNNFSMQTLGKGIAQPTIDEIVSAFTTDFRAIYERA